MIRRGNPNKQIGKDSFPIRSVQRSITHCIFFCSLRLSLCTFPKKETLKMSLPFFFMKAKVEKQELFKTSFTSVFPFYTMACAAPGLHVSKIWYDDTLQQLWSRSAGPVCVWKCGLMLWGHIYIYIMIYLCTQSHCGDLPSLCEEMHAF